MIAQVYPLKRMPRKCTVFDYAVDESLSLKRGDLVVIPFRDTKIYGVVATMRDRSLRAMELKSVIKHTGYTLREDELSFFEWLAHDLAQSVPSLLYHALPRPPKRVPGQRETAFKHDLMIPYDEASTIGRNAQELSKRRMAFVYASDLRRSAATIAKFRELHPQQKSLVIAPTVRDAKFLEHYLPQNDGVITGEETNNERFAVWQGFREKKHGCLIGTKLALLLADPSLSTIFVLRSGHTSHKQSDCNPRFDARLTALSISLRFQTNLYFFDCVPRVDDLAFVSSINVLSQGPSTPITIVDKHHEQTVSPHPVITHSAANEIARVLEEQKTVICVYNKKGSAQRLSCQDCKYAFVCPNCQGLLRGWSHTVSCTRCRYVNPIPLSCPSCRSTNIFQRGYGNERVAEALRGLFGVEVGVIDKDHPEPSTARIWLVTQYYYEQLFHPFKPASSVGLVVLLDADAPLFNPTFRALEKTVQRTEEWRGFAHAHRSAFLVQTDAPELFQEFYQDPRTVLEQELAERMALDLPPKRRWIQISYRDEEPRKAELQANILTQKLSSLGRDLRLTGPVFDEKTAWHLDLSLLPEDVEVFLQLFTALDDHYIIDTNAYSC